MANKTEQFLDLYRQLEYMGRITYFEGREDDETVNVIGKLMSVPHLAEYKEEINFCRVVRNFLTHNPKVSGEDFSIIPSDSMIKLLEDVLERISNPEKALKCSILREKMIIADIGDLLMPTLEKMHQMGYTNVPVYERKQLVGILTEKTLYSYICRQKAITLNEKTTLAALRSHLCLDNEKNRQFAFVSRDTPIHAVAQLFEDNYKKSRLLSVVYITENGKSSETILGMITPWDLID